MPSPTTLIMMAYSTDLGAGNIGHNEHTDIGSLTLLFNDQCGLQIKRGSEGWLSVPPRDGQAIVNVGDCLRFMSGNKLQSCLHRVIPPSDLTVQRYSFGYFLRPDNVATIKTPDGVQVSSRDWVEKKYSVHEASIATQKRDILTGWMESSAERIESM